MTEAFLESDTIDNVDADVLAAIYNSKHPSFFNAYMHGTPHKDLRFFLRTRVGAIPQMDSPEEVALVNCDGGGTPEIRACGSYRKFTAGQAAVRHALLQHRNGNREE